MERLPDDDANHQDLTGSNPPLNRRRFLASGVALGGGALITRQSRDTIRRAAAVAPAGSDIGAIEHIVFLMQENRSFDHYFGSYKGVRGFDDHRAGSLGSFAQPDPSNTTRPPLGVQLPFHLDTTTGLGECTRNIDHSWLTEHQSWRGGTMTGFVQTHTTPQLEGPLNGLLTMGYYKRHDLPFHYALADAFTIGDHYFSSVLGPSDPNRLMAISGSFDPGGSRGGPVLTTSDSYDRLGQATWTTVPELLQEAGVTWKVYNPPGQVYSGAATGSGFGNNVLPYFAAYRSPSSPLFHRAFTPTYPQNFAADVSRGTLPSVSWITSPSGYDEHPPAAPAYGAWLMNHVVSTLASNPAVWAKTALFIMYDENGGYFDHVAPPVPPAGTVGEVLDPANLPDEAEGVAGPTGLGFRVPLLVVSPFSRGGHVVSNVYDHTSQIRLLEERFGIHCSNLSAWRRRTVGDLTHTVTGRNVLTTPPRLPVTTNYRTVATTVQGCTVADVHEQGSGQPLYPLPAVQSMPRQEH